MYLNYILVYKNVLYNLPYFIRQIQIVPNNIASINIEPR
jgi:hypothetical protein